MRQYEAVYILDPGLDEGQLTAMVERFQGLVTDQGAEILHVDRWERRRLAYDIKGKREGYYVVMNFRGAPAVEAELGRVLRITDGILRHLIVKMDDRVADKAIAEARKAAEAKARAQAEQAAAAQAEAEAAAAAQAAHEAEAEELTAQAPEAPAEEAEADGDAAAE